MSGNSLDEFRHSFPAAAPSSEAPLCRPWDRGDLMRRVATFKSMTWFAKPKVVSAVNCARRGWINVDMDILACESCEARLLFSTPLAWSQQQVEKAALVFSLKLDSGHKLLCPWINNSCDERLAQFPPSTPEDLVDNYRQRYSALLQLSSLPVISPSAIVHMRSPQLEAFLSHSATIERVDGSAEVCQIESSGNEVELDSVGLYYQARKLISLCGWEPRSLPYTVDCKDGANHVVKDANTLQSSLIVADGQNSIVSRTNENSSENVEVNESSGVHMTPTDPQSVVLDCRLCGASVGLWAFSTVSRPVELFRLVGGTEVNGENSSGIHGAGNKSDDNSPSANRSLPTLNRTIAGGPPPRQQNFKATISLPIIGQNLRAKLYSDFGSSDHMCCDLETHSGSAVNNSGQVLIASKCKRVDEEHCISSSDDQVPLLTDGVSGEDDAVRKDITSNVVEGCALGKNAENTDVVSSLVEDHDKDSDSPSSTKASTLTGPGENSNNDSTLMVTSDDCNPPQNLAMDVEQGKEIYFPNNQDSLHVASSSEAHANGNGYNALAVRVDKDVAALSREWDKTQQPATQVMMFDPIKQHRHFCPWIIPGASGSPGWQQTLSALQRQRVYDVPSPAGSPSSSSIIKVDDPILSIRRLFMSPPAKRLKASGIDPPRLADGAN